MSTTECTVECDTICAVECDAKRIANHTKRATERNSLPTNQLFTPESFISSLGKTLAEANRFLTLCLRRAGLADLVPSHGDILLYLFSHGTAPMQELASIIGRDPSTVTALVKKLATAGYVSTEKSIEDRRVTNVSLTKKGNSLRDEFNHISKELVSTQMHNINAADFMITCRTLHTIRVNFAEACEQLAPPKGA